MLDGISVDFLFFAHASVLWFVHVDNIDRLGGSLHGMDTQREPQGWQKQFCRESGFMTQTAVELVNFRNVGHKINKFRALFTNCRLP